MVGGTIPWCRASAVNAASTPPAAPSRCPVMLFVELTMSPLFAQSPKTFFSAFVSAMSPTGVDVPCAFTYWTCSGFKPVSSRHRRIARCAGARRLRDVESIGRRGITGQLAVDARAALFRMLQFLDDQDAGALTRDEAVALLVERPRRLVRCVVPLAEGPRRGEPGDAEQRDGRFRSARDHHVHVAMLDVAHRLADGVIARRTRRDGCEVHPRRAVANGDLPAGEIHDDRRNEEWVHAPVTLVDRREMRLLERREPSHSAADDDADPLSQRPVRRQPRVLERELRRGQPELDEQVVAAHLLLVHESSGVESLDLTGDAARQILRVEARDGPYATLAGDRRLPRLLRADPQRGDQPDAGDDDSAFDSVHASLNGSRGSGKPPAAARLFLVLVDEVDGVLDGLDVLGFLVRDLHLELLFHRHHQLDDVEGVGAEVLDEGGLRLDLVLTHPELFRDDALDLRLDGHARSFHFWAEPGWRGLVAQANPLARGWLLRVTSLADTVDAAEPGVAVQIRLAANALAARDALTVVAGFGPRAVAVVEALRAFAAALSLAQPDLARLTLATVLVAGAHHRAFSLAAFVAGEALLSSRCAGRSRAPRGAAVGGFGDVAGAE